VKEFHNDYDRKSWLKYLPDNIDLKQPRENFEQSGMLNVDKPSGITSMDVLRVLKKVGPIKKAGHGGTLDPMASGVLPVFLNRATKVSGDYLGANKTYEGEFILGQSTDTQDITGKPVGEKSIVDPELTLAVVNEEASILQGEILQLPPIYSALKKGGKPLYKLARQGIEVLPEKRPVTVDKFTIIEKKSTTLFSFIVECQKGVYVRTLVHDLGQILGFGATLSSLRRLEVGHLSVETSVPLEKLQSADDIEKHLIVI